MAGVGLDVGTSFIIAAREVVDGTEYKEARDAFLRIKANTPIAAAMMEKGLKDQKHFKDTDGSFVVIGQDAIDRAIERHLTVSRPMHKGVISAKERDARRILKFILSEVLGKPVAGGEKVVFSIPAQPVDQDANLFDTGFHEDALSNDLRDLGYTPVALNEAEAICYSELEDDNYTGICLSFGAGMVNVCIMSSGEAVAKFSTTKSGDWIDSMAAQATGESEAVVQVEKEGGDFIVGKEVKNSPVLSAVAAYYTRLIEYTVKCLGLALEKSGKLPKFSEPLPVIISGGTSKAGGFVKAFEEALHKQQLPIQIREVRAAKDQLRSVARGCLIAGSI